TLPTNGTLGTATGNGTIVNDDTQPAVSIGNASQNEANSRTTAFTFGVSLSNPSSQTVTVNYATADGTATTADSDYTAASGTVTFAPDVTAHSVTVNVNGDTQFASPARRTSDLTGPTNGTLGTATGNGTIVNDDTQPAVS